MDRSDTNWLAEYPLEEYLQENSIDCVIFGYDAGKLKVLLIRWKYSEMWSLPGGYIHRSESFDQAAGRILQSRTGLESIFLKQFHTFSAVDRNQPSEEEMEIMLKIIANRPSPFGDVEMGWFIKRFITTGYFALVNVNETKPNPDFLSDRCEWIDIDQVPQLLSDHNKVLDTALEYLRNQINYLPIGISLLPEKFTMKELRHLYESILKMPLDRSNFQRKMLKLDFLIRQEKKMTGASNKAPYLYSFDPRKYQSLLEKGMGFYFLQNTNNASVL